MGILGPFFFFFFPYPQPPKKAFFVCVFKFCLLGRWGWWSSTRGVGPNLVTSLRKESRKVWESSFSILSTCERTHWLSKYGDFKNNNPHNNNVATVGHFFFPPPNTQPHRYVSSSHWLFIFGFKNLSKKKKNIETHISTKKEIIF